MLAGYVLGLREGLEAALILGITFGVLRRMNRSELAPVAWLGVGVAVGLSIIAAAILSLIGARLEGTAEELFEGTMMLFASGVLTWMILWMAQQGRQSQLGIEREIEVAATRRQRTAVFAIAFFAVLREGIETALFLSAAAFQDSQAGVFAGGLAGIATAALLGWGLYRATIRLDIRGFFRVTGAILILFAAGLFAHGIHEFVEAGVLPALIDPLWTTEYLISESSFVGTLLRTLFGYNADPTLTEVLAYFAYFVTVLVFVRRTQVRSSQWSPAS
ncbi:MAG TPA: FTR1 family protein [Anaerolineales bacterium]|nr:FTR1 family protein [Anaerolineales bacterium]